MGVFKTTTNNAFVTSHGHEIRFTNKWRLLPDQCNLRSKMHGVIHWADGSMDSRIKRGYDEGVKFFVHPHPSLPDLIG